MDGEVLLAVQRLAQAQIDRMQQAAREGDADTIQTTLSQVTQDTETIRLFTELMLQPGDTSIVQAIDRRQEPLRFDTITVVQTPAGFWMMESEGADQLRCTPVQATTLRQQLRDLYTGWK
jgi:hypothetical protein